jgi:hypothetical protein
MSVTDAWKLSFYHRIIDPNRAAFDDYKKTTIKKFAGCLSLQLISCACSLLSDVDPIDNIRSVVTTTTSGSDLSDLTKNLSQDSTVSSIRSMVDANSNIHRLCKLPKRDEEGLKKKSLARKCKMCSERGVRHDVKYYCHDCGMSHSFCSPDEYNKERDCFAEHVRKIKRVIPKRTATR